MLNIVCLLMLAESLYIYIYIVSQYNFNVDVKSTKVSFPMNVFSAAVMLKSLLLCFAMIIIR